MNPAEFIIQVEGRGRCDFPSRSALFVTDWFIEGNNKFLHDPDRMEQTLWQMSQGVERNDPIVLLDRETEWWREAFERKNPNAVTDAVESIEVARDIMRKLGFTYAKIAWYANVFTDEQIDIALPIYEAADAVAQSCYIRTWTGDEWVRKLVDVKARTTAWTGYFNSRQQFDTPVWPVFWHDDGQNRRIDHDRFRGYVKDLLSAFRPDHLFMYSRRYAWNDINGFRWDSDGLVRSYWWIVLDEMARMEREAA